MTDFVKQLKEQINIAEVVGEYVRLRKTGSNHMGLCPFHAERSPSFSVSEKKGIYHCFGCQRGGDVISFVQEIQGISFHEAIRTLASKFALKLPPEFAARGPAARSGAVSTEDKNEIYYKLNRFVAQFYHEKLLSPAGKNAREYLATRGVTDTTVKTAYLGFAPNDWAELYDFLLSKKAPMDKAEELGLIRRKEKGADSSGRAHYDLFRDRVMFPVTDSRGRVIAFGGRSLGEADGPKYLNSSESPIFKKGNHLFGLFFAQKEIRAEDMCVVVEGFMDCLSLQQAGIGYAVATLGTALTEKQVSILKRFTRNIVVLFDGDAAGQEAQARAMETFLNEDVVVRGVALPDEYDPDEFVREKGADALGALLKNAPFLLDQRILEFAGQAGAHAEARARASEQILPWIAKISADTSRLVRLEELSSLFSVNYAMLERRVNELRAQNPKRPPSGSSNVVGGPQVRAVASSAMRPRAIAQTPLDPLDVRVIECVVKSPRLFDSIVSTENVLNGLETEATRDLIMRILASKEEAASGSVLDLTDVPALKTVLTRALVVLEQEQGKALSESEREAETQEIKDLERKLIRRGLERQKDSLRAMINKADGSGQVTEYAKLMNEYNELVKKSEQRDKEIMNL